MSLILRWRPQISDESLLHGCKNLKLGKLTIFNVIFPVLLRLFALFYFVFAQSISPRFNSFYAIDRSHPRIYP